MDRFTVGLILILGGVARAVVLLPRRTLIAAIIVTAGAAIAVVAVFMLSSRSAGAASVIALFAGMTIAVGMFWFELRHWSDFVDSTWQSKMGSLAIAGLPLVLGILALGLRRKDRRVGVEY
jgi:hypothetical protein